MAAASLVALLVLVNLRFQKSSGQFSEAHLNDDESIRDEWDKMEEAEDAESDELEVEDLYNNVDHPNQCDLKLVCTMMKHGDVHLKSSGFMQGLETMTRLKMTAKAFKLAIALKTGETNGECSPLFPDCHLSEDELLKAVEEMDIVDEGRFRRSAEGPPVFAADLPRDMRAASRSAFPPLLQPAGAHMREECRSCDSRRLVCTMYSVGSTAGCWSLSLVAGYPGQLVCNALTSPGHVGCSMNTIHCFTEHCGLFKIPFMSSLRD